MKFNSIVSYFFYKLVGFGLGKSIEGTHDCCMSREPNKHGLEAIRVLRERYRFDARVARALGCSVRVFQYWSEQKGWIGPEWVGKVAAHTGIPTYDLRSDIFPKSEPALQARIDELEAENHQLRRFKEEVSELVAA